MAATAADLLSLPELRRELRVPAGETTLDDTLRRQTEDAAAVLSRQTHVPLVDRSTVYTADPAPQQPALLRAPWLSRVTAVTYWTPAGSLAADPDGAVTLTDLGRLAAGREDVEVWPPVDGWPDRLAGTLLRFEVVEGLQADHPDAGLFRSALVAMVRELQGGYRETPARPAWQTLIRPVRRYLA